MTVIIVLAVAIFLVGVQASYISPIQREFNELEDFQKAEVLSTLEDRDVGTEVNNDGAAGNSATFGELKEIQKMETIDDVLYFLQNYKDVMGCSGDTCEWCLKKVCVQVTFLAGTNEFQFCATYKGNNVFCKTFPARDFKYCKKIKIKFFTVNVCLEIKNVNISDGRACMDVKVSAAGMSKTFRDICMGISSL
ncbi:hypothetical protein CHS0354_027753 [Potamilus streckersoni]|uniref:DUF4773 domain-containing protein n=1 Tax=Potamilus streckersoni TaxID=2493646 RepID=A0AAE0T3S7_9BIVA|nr:hypothetical protein CHS0354_027753 [Potamilus streckersoni]